MYPTGAARSCGRRCPRALHSHEAARFAPSPDRSADTPRLIRAPLTMRAALAAGGDRDPGVTRLQERVKAAFDPCGILNPGLDPAADH